MIEIIDPGPLTTVQDRGRPGWAHLGVGHSGAADLAAAALANRLVGNPPDAAVLECTFGGLRVRVHTAVLVATAGAVCTIDVTGGPPASHQHPSLVPAGATLALTAPTQGLRTYVAVRGGVEAIVVMGSRSTDTLSGLGPPPLRAGDIVAIGPDPQTPVPSIGAPVKVTSSSPIRVWPGPRFDWFHPRARDVFATADYVVQPDSNRIGVRLAGPSLERLNPGELPPEGLITGAIQVPADGQPVILLADHGTTGGYPVIAIVDPGDVARIAQARPGHMLTFAWR